MNEQVIFVGLLVFLILGPAIRAGEYYLRQRAINSWHELKELFHE